MPNAGGISEVQFFSTLGVGGILAGLMFMWYRSDVKTYTEQWKGQSEMFAAVVKENSKVIAELIGEIRSLREDQAERYYRDGAR